MKHVRCDLLVIGSGAGGLSAAVTGALQGLDVLVVEKEPVIGGATARSGGWLWIPANHLGGPDDLGEARRYIAARAGRYFDAPRVDAFLANGPAMVRMFEARTALAFWPVNYPDYNSDVPGASQGGRSIMAQSFDARPLGPDLQRLRPPLTPLTFAGMMVAPQEQMQFMRAGRSLAGAVHVARRLIGQARARLRSGRAEWTANGNALVARLVKSAQDLGVTILTDSPVRRLRMAGDQVVGATIYGPDGAIEIEATKGVVLATGGFPGDVTRRKALVPWAASVPVAWDVLPAGNTGDGLRLGEEAGGYVANRVAHPIAFGPIGALGEQVGNSRAFPHLAGRAKPGVIAVTRAGRRFVSEARSYHDFGIALLEATREDPGQGAFVICDARAMRDYGLGFAKPWPMPSRLYRRTGYLVRGRSLADLAARAGIDAAQLETTVAAYNADAADGRDPAFDKGATKYQRNLGDPLVMPNPNVAPLREAPFYAVKVVPGALGTFAGLATDAQARVLNEAGKPITGLYAVGNDMESIFGGDYVGGGTTLGPAMTFGYIAARHASGVR